MNSTDRIAKIYLLITAAQVLVDKGDVMQLISAKNFLQDARIVCVADDKVLAENKQGLDNAIHMAHGVIDAYQDELKGNENTTTLP